MIDQYRKMCIFCCCCFIFLDVDECILVLYECQVIVDCVNIYGLYNCVCDLGYIGDGCNCRVRFLRVIVCC